MSEPINFCREKENRTGIVTKILDGQPVEVVPEDHPQFRFAPVTPGTHCITVTGYFQGALLYGCSCGAQQLAHNDALQHVAAGRV